MLFLLGAHKTSDANLLRFLIFNCCGSFFQVHGTVSGTHSVDSLWHLHLQSGGYFGSAVYPRLQSSSYVRHLSFAGSYLALHVFVFVCSQNCPLKSFGHSQWTSSKFELEKQVPPFLHGLESQGFFMCSQNSPLKSFGHSQWKSSKFELEKQVPPFLHGLESQGSALHGCGLQSIVWMSSPMMCAGSKGSNPKGTHSLFLLISPSPHDTLHFDQGPHGIQLLHFSSDGWRIVASFDGLLIARSMPKVMSLLFPANPPRSFDFCAACEYVRVCSRATRPCCHIFIKSQFVV